MDEGEEEKTFLGLTRKQWVILLIIITIVSAAIGDILNSLNVAYTAACTPGVSRIGPPCGNGWG
jgi:hypothetical protein